MDVDPPANPEVPTTGAPAFEAVHSTINSYPDPRVSDGPTLPADTEPHDAPGPSSSTLPDVKPRPRSPQRSQRDVREFLSQFADSDDESDDEPVYSMPIYMNTALHPSMSLFQYPLNHKSLEAPNWALDRGKAITSRVKEGVQRVEIEVPINADVTVWREDRASELGYVADVNGLNGDDVEGGYGFGGRRQEEDKKKKTKKKEGKEKDKWGDKLRMRSEAVPSAPGYFSGVIRDNELHLHPISRRYQFRTTLNYLDDYDQKNRERSARYRASLEEDEEKRAKASAGVQAGAAIQRGKAKIAEENDGSGSIKDFRTKMWQMQDQENGDQWVSYGWKSGGDDSVEKKFGTLAHQVDRRETLTTSTKPLDYLDGPKRSQ